MMTRRQCISVGVAVGVPIVIIQVISYFRHQIYVESLLSISEAGALSEDMATKLPSLVSQSIVLETVLFILFVGMIVGLIAKQSARVPEDKSKEEL